MVIKVKNIIAFIRLVRLQNLVIIALTQIFLRWFVLIPSLGVNNFESQIWDIYFLGIVLATCLIASAGYVINDYFDRKTDLINHPATVVIGKTIARRAAMFWHIVLSAAGVLLGSFVAYKLGLFRFSLVFFMAAGVLWFYSTTYKRQLIIGNLMVAILVAIVPLMVIIFEFPLLIKAYKSYIMAAPRSFDYLIAWFMFYTAFAFVLTLIREVVKDIEDFEGDVAFGCQTIPIVWGIKVSKIIVTILIIATIIPVAFILFRYLQDLHSIIYISILIIAPLIYLVFRIQKAEKAVDYNRISTIIKFVMFNGLLYSLVAYYIIQRMFN